MAHDNGVTVGSGARRQFNADGAAGAAAVFNDDLLTPHFGKPQGDQSRQRVGAAARREGGDETHRFVRKVGRGLRLGRSDCQNTQQDDRR